MWQFDLDFLAKLDLHREREIYAKIIALNFQEQPIEQIEGQVTQGSINIDGSSAVRRTCSLSLVAKDLNINDYYWGIKSKFELQIGLRNNIDDRYPEIIWFPQGKYVITTFNTSQTTNTYTVSISGQDKMCLLNGSLGGTLNASIDFGTEEFLDKETNVIIYNKIPIEKIIREAIHFYGGEPYHNIVINDLDDAAVELLEYRGDVPLYLLRDVKANSFTNYTVNGDMEIAVAGSKTTLAGLGEVGRYDPRVELAPAASAEGTIVTFPNDPKQTEYTVAKLEYGQTAGYRPTELTYAGDLISNVGDSLTSVLDKIKSMLGDYEYFYDLDGRFVFQKKLTYIQTSWNNMVKRGDEEWVENAAHTSAVQYRFEDGKLITSFQNSPNLANLRNDFSVWGERESVSGAKLPVHYRYAIDIKPTKYTSIQINEEDISGYNASTGLRPQTSKEYTTKDYDWREIIYRMAADYYQYNQLDCYIPRLMAANPETCAYGVTGYEPYYLDLFSFWRELYNPTPDPEYIFSDTTGTDLFIKGRYVRVTNEWTSKNIYALRDNELIPLLDAIEIPYEASFNETESELFYVSANEGWRPVSAAAKNQIEKKELFVYENNKFIELVKSSYANNYEKYVFEDDGRYYKVSTLDSAILPLYYDNGEYKSALLRSKYDIEGVKIQGVEPASYSIDYYVEYYNYETSQEKENRYWSKSVIEAPAQLNFWFDFLDAESELGQFSVRAVGDRAKAVNDNNVKAIYFREVPDLIFVTYEDYNSSNVKEWDGYNTPVYVNGTLENMFTISAQGKSAQDKIDELVYNHSYCIESVTIQAIPVYYLQPNTRVFVRDEASKINGEYIVSKLSIPLAYNGTMQITATKAPERLY